MTSTSWQETEIGEFPSSWDIQELGSIYEIQQGKALSGRKNRPDDELYPFLRTSNVYWGRIVLTTLDKMPFSASEREKLQLRPRDLLICEGGDIGRTAIWNGEIVDCFYQNHLFRVRPKHDDIEPSFHMYWMQAALTILGLYGGQGNKTTIPNLSRSRLSSFLVPLPPLPEQRRIAAVLNAIQEAIAAQEDVIAAARQFKRSLMQRLFTYGPGREPAPTKETEIGEIPAHWEIRPVAEIAYKPQYGYTASATWLDTGVKFLRITDITDSGVLWSSVPFCECSESEIDRYGLLENDIVFARTGATTGKSFLVLEPPKSVFASYLIRLRLKPGINPAFVQQYFNTASYWKQISMTKSGATQPGINGTRLAELLVPMTSEKEQRSISEALSAANAKIAAEEDRKTALDTLFKSMLHQLMTGQICLLAGEGLPLPKN